MRRTKVQDGLLNKGGQTQQDQQQAETKGGPGGQQGYQNQIKSNVSQDQQELYDIFVAQGTRLAAEASDAIRAGRGQGNMKDMFVDALLSIIDRVKTGGEQNGFKFDDNILVYGGGEILTNLMLMSGIDLDESQIQQITGEAVGRWMQRGIKDGSITPEQLQEMAKRGQGGQGGQPQVDTTGSQQQADQMQGGTSPLLKGGM